MDYRIGHSIKVDQISETSRLGNRIAHEELIAAIIRYGRVAGLDLFLSSSVVDPNLRRNLQSRYSAIASGGGVSATVHECLDVRYQIRYLDFLYMARGAEFVRAAALRDVTGTTFPVSTVCHSLIWHEFWPKYYFALHAMRPWDCFIAPSSAAVKGLKHIEELVNEKCRSSQVRKTFPQLAYIPLGVFEENFGYVEKDNAKRQLGILSKTIVVTCVGRLTELYKADLDSLLVASQRLLEKGYALQVILAGTEAQPQYIQKLHGHIAALGLERKCRILSNFSDELKTIIYAASDICVFPSDNLQETFGLAILEAMASGVPVIASDWSGYRDLVRHGETGFLIPCHSAIPNDDELWDLLSYADVPSGEAFAARNTIVDVKVLEQSLETLISDESLRRTFGDAAARIVGERFTWRHTIAKLEEVWAEQIMLRDRSVESKAPVDCHIQPANMPTFCEVFGAKKFNYSELKLSPQAQNLIAGKDTSLYRLLPDEHRRMAKSLLLAIHDGSTLGSLCPEHDLEMLMTLLFKKGLLEL